MFPNQVDEAKNHRKFDKQGQILFLTDFHHGLKLFFRIVFII
jgi:hypothetical protein